MVQLLAHDSKIKVRLGVQVTIREIKLTDMHVAVSCWDKAFEATTQNDVSLRFELDALHVAGRHSKSMLWDSVERLCTGFSWVMRTHARSYRKRPNAALVDGQLRIE